VGLRGGITWGIGYALHEEIKLDGHGPHTNSFWNYHIPHFSDIPDIDIECVDCHRTSQRPRGCGELPVIPTIGAIANAVYNAIGIRFYSTPITPDRVLKALY
jgi:xanthine dehydrogenase molybdenum-binding subunit